MLKTRALLTLLPLLLPSVLTAYNTREHKEFAAAAALAACPADTPLCAELNANLPFFLYGSIHEDEAVKGHKAVFNGVEFREEEPERYGPCSEYVVAGKKHMYCNHYFFLDSFLAGKEEGSCGGNMLGATDPDCGPGGFRWESARQRGLRLWAEKVMPHYNSGKPEGKARAYYWLGRVAHLLADVAVPAHDIPHKMGHVEFEHRCFEYEASRMEAGPLPALPRDENISSLYVELARNTLSVHDAVRAEECRFSPLLKGCERLRATPTLPLESGSLIRDSLLTDAIMKSKSSALNKPEIIAERQLARRQLELIRPLTVAYTARLLELFGAQAGLAVKDLEVPAEAPACAFEGRVVRFDGAPR
ncbi:MAG: hypothetical protein NDI60_00700 [Elusimicrobiales bacterium]|nr:hypothetical protein [Elusimicrobiales bacterium]